MSAVIQAVKKQSRHYSNKPLKISLYEAFRKRLF